MFFRVPIYIDDDVAADNNSIMITLLLLLYSYTRGVQDDEHFRAVYI